MSKPNILINISNLMRDIVGKVNKTDIVDNLTTIEKGKVLDSSQGKVLKDNLNLYNQRGYIEPIRINDADNLIENGKYTDVIINTPTNDMYNIEVIKHADRFITQIAIRYANNGGFQISPVMFFRSKSQDIWQPWKEITTTDITNLKIDKDIDNNTLKGLNINTWLSLCGDSGGAIGLLNNLYRVSGSEYRFTNSHQSATGSGFKSTIFERKPKFIIANGSSSTKDNVADITEYELAIIDKVDILSSTATITNPKTQVKMLNGWNNLQLSFALCSATKVGNIVILTGMVSVGVKARGTKILTLPEKFRPIETQTCFATLETTDDNFRHLRINILPSGDVILYQDLTTVNPINWVSFNGIIFNTNITT